MHEIKVSRELLESLRMLSDKQIKMMGYDPISVTVALMDCENNRPKPKFFPCCS